MFEKLNRRSTVREDIDTQAMEFKPLKDFCGTKIKVDGFFFTEGRYGTQVVVVGNGYLINMPKRAAEQFEKIEKVTKDIHENHPGLKDVPEEKTNALRNAYIQLAENTDKYISLKSLVPSTTRGEKRLDFAKGLRNIANDTLEDLGFNIYKEKMEEEIEVEKEEDMSL